MNSIRFQRGMAMLTQINGAGGEAVLKTSKILRLTLAAILLNFLLEIFIQDQG